MDEATLNQLRFKSCVALLSSKGLASKPEYKNLIDSGSLAFLTQINIKIRQQANQHAHSILPDISQFRQALTKAKEISSHLCSPSDFTSVNGLVDFVEAIQK